MPCGHWQDASATPASFWAIVVPGLDCLAFSGQCPMSPDAGGIRSSDAGAAATDATASDRDERLAELVGRMFDELRQGKTPDVHEHARAAPDLAEELRSLWAAILVADCA